MRSFFLAGAAMAALMSTQAAAQSSDSLDALLACRAITENAERLACFDEAANALGGDIESGEVVAVSRADVEAVEREGFGLNLSSLPRLSFSLFGDGRGSSQAAQPSGERLASSEGISAVQESPELQIVERTQSGEIDVVMMTIDRTTTVGYNTTRFHMTNGQIWEVSDGTSVRVPRVRNGVQNTAEVRRAAMGSFLLRVNGEGRAYRVRRIM